MKIRLAAPASQASGKQLQEIVYYLWRGVQYARGWVRGSNPGTTDQLAARAAFAALTRRWSTIQPAQREAWSDWASANEVVDSLGRSVRMPALAAYVRINSIGHLAFGAYRDDAPTTGAPAGVTSVNELVYDGPGQTITTVAHAQAGNLAGYKLLIKLWPLATGAVSADLRRGVLYAGYNAGSFPALTASGTSYNLNNARRAYLGGSFAGVGLQVVSPQGLVSLPFVAAKEVQVA